MLLLLVHVGPSRDEQLHDRRIPAGHGGVERGHHHLVVGGQVQVCSLIHQVPGYVQVPEKGGKGKRREAIGGVGIDQAAALSIYDQLRNAGIPADIRPVKSEAGITYRVRISNLATKAEAAALGAKLKGQMGITEPKVSK